LIDIHQMPSIFLSQELYPLDRMPEIDHNTF
jgi:hypothetical protein